MGFEPTTLRDLVGCSTTELLDSVMRKGQIVGDSAMLLVSSYEPARGCVAA